MTDAKKKRKFKVYFTENKIVTMVCTYKTKRVTCDELDKLISKELKKYKNSFAEVCE